MLSALDAFVHLQLYAELINGSAEAYALNHPRALQLGKSPMKNILMLFFMSLSLSARSSMTSRIPQLPSTGLPTSSSLTVSVWGIGFLCGFNPLLAFSFIL